MSTHPSMERLPTRALMRVSEAYLDDEHRAAFSDSMQRVLSGPQAELTMAQLIDGLPLLSVAYESSTHISRNHPLHQHKELCEGALEKARSLRTQLDIDTVLIQSHVLQAYADAKIDSRSFFIRLIEMVTVGVHFVAVQLFNMTPKCHTAKEIKDITDWQEPPHWHENRKLKYREWMYPMWPTPPTLFNHGEYCDFDIYPNGVADVAGYWAEDKIFGGVVVFDRGESGFDARSVHFHNGWMSSSIRIVQILNSELESTAKFLLGKTSEPKSPLPWEPTSSHRYRLNIWDAIVVYHVFRDPWERKIHDARPEEPCSMAADDMPGGLGVFEALDEMARTGSETADLPPEYDGGGLPHPVKDSSWIIKQGGHIGTPLRHIPLEHVEPPEGTKKRPDWMAWSPEPEQALPVADTSSMEGPCLDDLEYEPCSDGYVEESVDWVGEDLDFRYPDGGPAEVKTATGRAASPGPPLKSTQESPDLTSHNDEESIAIRCSTKTVGDALAEPSKGAGPSPIEDGKTVDKEPPPTLVENATTDADACAHCLFIANIKAEKALGIDKNMSDESRVQLSQSPSSKRKLATDSADDEGDKGKCRKMSEEAM